MARQKRRLAKRAAMMISGILLIGVCVGCYRLSGFGVDAFTCMNLGISGFVRLSFGTWQLIMNAAILAAVFFLARRCIGIGTIVNMVGVGYLADFLCWLVGDCLAVPMTFPLRVGALVLGSLFAGLGVALYMAADMGIAAYDSVAVIIEQVSNGRISFQHARIMSDIAVVGIGVVFCLMARGNILEILGVGTLCNALFNGPLIQFFRIHVVDPLAETGTD